jgi:hypothetical protein
MRDFLATLGDHSIRLLLFRLSVAEPAHSRLLVLPPIGLLAFDKLDR